MEEENLFPDAPKLVELTVEPNTPEWDSSLRKVIARAIVSPDTSIAILGDYIAKMQERDPSNLSVFLDGTNYRYLTVDNTAEVSLRTQNFPEDNATITAMLAIPVISGLYNISGSIEISGSTLPAVPGKEIQFYTCRIKSSSITESWV